MDEMIRSGISSDSLSEAFYAILVLFVEQREQHPHNHSFNWSEIDLAYVHAALTRLTEDRRRQFFERFKEYQVVKMLGSRMDGRSRFQ